MATDQSGEIQQLQKRIATVIADCDEWCCEECRAAAVPDVYMPVAAAVLDALGLGDPPRVAPAVLEAVAEASLFGGDERD